MEGREIKNETVSGVRSGTSNRRIAARLIGGHKISGAVERVTDRP